MCAPPRFGACSPLFLAQALHESQLAHFARLQQQQQAQFTQWQQMQLVQQQMALQRQLCENSPAVLCSNAVGRMIGQEPCEDSSSMCPPRRLPQPPAVPAPYSGDNVTTAPSANNQSAVDSGAGSGDAQPSSAAAASAAPTTRAPAVSSPAEDAEEERRCSRTRSPPRKPEGARGSSKIDIGSATARFKILSEMNAARAAMQRMPPGPQGQQEPQPGARNSAGFGALACASRGGVKPQLSARKGSGFGCSGGGACAGGVGCAGVCDGLGPGAIPGCGRDVSAGGSGQSGGSGSSRDDSAICCNEIDEASVWSWLNNDQDMTDMSMIEVKGLDMDMGASAVAPTPSTPSAAEAEKKKRGGPAGPRLAALDKQRSANNVDMAACDDAFGCLSGMWRAQLHRLEGRVISDDG